MAFDHIEWIRSGLKKPGKTQKGIAEALGVAHPQITQLLKIGGRRLKVDEIPKIAEYLEIAIPLEYNQFVPMSVPIVSWISAGALQQTEIVDNFDHVSYIEGCDLDPNGDWIALRVEGRSMDKISPQDSIIFVNRKEKTLVPNGCYIISDGYGGATYKRFRLPNIFEPVSTKGNEYPTIKFEIGKVPEIIGRVRKSILSL